jgi:hypothetical protein
MGILLDATGAGKIPQNAQHVHTNPLQRCYRLQEEGFLSQEFAEASELARGRPVVIGLGEGGSGMVDVYDTVGKRVVSAQATKANEGCAYVYDLNGDSCNVLAPRIPSAPRS